MWYGVYWATPPTLADTQAAAFRFDSTGALVVTSSGGGGPTVVVGDNTVDFSHAAPTDALDDRSHLYAFYVGFGGTFADYGAPVALTALQLPYQFDYRFANDDLVVPRSLLVSAIPMAQNQVNGFSGTHNDFLASWAVFASSAQTALYPQTGGGTVALCTESVLVGSDGTNLWRLRIDPANKALTTAPYARDYDSLPVRQRANGEGKLVVVAGLPEVADTEDAPTPYYQPNALAGVMKAGPGWLLSCSATAVVEVE